MLPSMFEAPNLRHLQLSDLTFLSPSTQLLNKNATAYPPIVTFSLEKIPTDLATLMSCLASMPHLKVLKIGSSSFSRPSKQTRRGKLKFLAGSQPNSAFLALKDLEEFEYQGTSNYLEALAARISAPLLKKLTVSVFNTVSRANLDTSFEHFSRLISGAADLAFQFARVRFRDGFSIVMDHDELWTGRGAFELIFAADASYDEVAPVASMLAPMPSTVQSLLLEDGDRDYYESESDREGWRELLRVFDKVKTLCVAGRLVKELEESLKPDEKGSAVQTLSPELQEIVRYGPELEFADFVRARQDAGVGSPVCVVSGPKNRLTLF